MKRLGHYIVLIRSNDFMNKQYICKDFKDNAEMQEYIKANYTNWHIVTVRID